MTSSILPYGKIKSPQDLGRAVRAKRTQDKLTQNDLVALCGVGTRFLSDLENGKPTLQLGKVIQVVSCVGLELSVRPRGWSDDVGP